MSLELLLALGIVASVLVVVALALRLIRYRGPSVAARRAEYERARQAIGWPDQAGDWPYEPRER